MYKLVLMLVLLSGAVWADDNETNRLLRQQAIDLERQQIEQRYQQQQQESNAYWNQQNLINEQTNQRIRMDSRLDDIEREIRYDDR